ncbi:M56 family metallopeptidase [Gimesia chilikensis]|uniref:M56 family metallopeptidase n=1 Tax=Gimesia chilikensis TaxID=2605989 RepID=UPI00118CCCD3|nr:M56 family metallopeptidase [Gimesia chilikensis]QDT82588.1 Regulatory protein BlaR1 [Gimesia chilikensis]
MTEFLTAANGLFSFLVTYLIHSTLLGLLVLFVFKYGPRIGTETRVTFLKAALLGPLLSSLIVTLDYLPHFGWQWSITSVTEASSSPAETDHQRDRDDLLNSALMPETQGKYARGSRDNATAAPALAAVDAKTQESSSRQSPSGSAHGWIIRSVCCLIFLTACFSGGMLILYQLRQLRRLRLEGLPVTTPDTRSLVKRLSRQAGLREPVSVLESQRIRSPFTAGIIRPFILIPARFLGLLNAQEKAALLAHEIVHVARRDSLWKLLGELLCRSFFFQPLNRCLFRKLEIEMEFVADAHAALLLEERTGLARCLTKLCEWILTADASRREPQLSVGMAAFRSTLGHRIECLLEDRPLPPRRFMRTTMLGSVLVLLILLVAVAPRAAATPRNPVIEEEPSMKQSLTTLAVLASLTLPAGAEDKQSEQARPAVTSTQPDAIPEGAMNLNGMLVGQLLKKDVERGTFVVKVDAIPRVWKNSKAENPKSLIGKNIEVNGVFGKWLDVLLLVKPGETLEFEARHDRGAQLTFPGELLRKVAPYKAEDYPVLPEEFRGFRGAVTGKVLKKDPDTFELIVQVDKVTDTWKKSEAENSKSIEGKKMMLAGFWRRKEAYYKLNEGDRIEVGLQHIGRQSDHLSVAEFVRKTDEKPDRDSAPARDQKAGESTGFPAGMRGFRGILIGTLVSKDVEKGEFVFTADKVKRVWKKNGAKDTKSCEGRQFTVQGVSGKWLDVLLVLKPGDRLECEAFHNRGDHLNFPSELLKKID